VPDNDDLGTNPLLLCGTVSATAFFALASAKPTKERRSANKKERVKSETAERERKRANFSSLCRFTL
jgi:hypothetical protein